MELIQFQPEHLRTLSLQENQRMLTPLLTDPTYAESLTVAGPAYTALQGNRVLGCAGIVHQWKGRAIAWSLLDRNCGKQMLSIHRATLNFLNDVGVRRVEAYVDANFQAAIHWALMLGFKVEGLMLSFTPDGRPSYLCARIKDC